MLWKHVGEWQYSSAHLLILETWRKGATQVLWPCVKWYASCFDSKSSRGKCMLVSKESIASGWSGLTRATWKFDENRLFGSRLLFVLSIAWYAVFSSEVNAKTVETCNYTFSNSLLANVMFCWPRCLVTPIVNPSLHNKLQPRLKYPELYRSLLTYLLHGAESFLRS